MTDAPTPQTFDISELFTGKAFPKDTVDIYTDEETAYKIYKANQRVADATARGILADITEADAELAELRKTAEKSRVKIYLTGVSRELRKGVSVKNAEKYPRETDFLGREKPNIEADEAFVDEFWALHIEAIERADGSRINAPDPGIIKILREQSPDAAIAAIDAGINELTQGIKAGFEDLVTDHDFLSQP